MCVRPRLREGGVLVRRISALGSNEETVQCSQRNRFTQELDGRLSCRDPFSLPLCVLPVPNLLCTVFPSSCPGDVITPLVAQTVKRLSAMQETWVRSLGWEDPLEKEMSAHSSILAWTIPWTMEPGRLLSMGSQRVGHD